MNFNEIDLNVNNYTIQELFIIIGVTDIDIDNINYTKKDIIHSYTNSIISTVRKSHDIDENTKFDVIDFFHEIKRRLLEFMISQENNVDIEYTKSNENTLQKGSLQPVPVNNTYNTTIENYTKELFTDKKYFFDHLVDKMLQKTDIMNLVPSIVSQTGIHNPIDRKTVYKVLNIDTIFRERYKLTKSTDFIHYLQTPLKNVTSMRLSSVEIPNIWHMFNKNLHNNVIEITVYNFHEPNSASDKNGENFDKAISDLTIANDPQLLITRKYRIEIPQGNYTTEEFMFTMNKLLWNHNQDYDPNVLTTDSKYAIKSKKHLDNSDYSGLRFLKFSVDPLTGETILGTIPRMETSIGSNPISHRVNTWAKKTLLPNNNGSGNQIATNSQIPYNDYILSFQTIDDNIDTRNKSYTMESLHSSFAFTIDFDPDKRFENYEIPYFNTGWFLGFRKNKYHATMSDIITTEYSNELSPNESLLSRKATIQSEGVYGSHFHYYLYVIVDDFQQNKYESVLTNSEFINNSNILARVTINTNFNTIIFNNDSEHIEKKREYFGPVTIDKLHFKLIDKFGRVIDIRDNNFSLSLEFEQLYN